MPRTVRFHLDENCHEGIVAALRRHGIDVTSTDVELQKAKDPDQLAFATACGRALVTHDQDFLRPLFAQMPHAGIIYCHQMKYPLGKLVEAIVLVWEVLEPEEVQNRVEYL